MNEVIRDIVFGEVTYKHRWLKSEKEKIVLFGQPWKINVVASAYTGEQICENQRNSYKYFKKNRSQLLKKIPSLLQDYLKRHVPAVTEESSHTLIRPKTLLFDRSGMIVILCDATWDEENGIGIQLKPKFCIDVQDAFL